MYLLLDVYPFYFIPAALVLVLTIYYLDYRTMLSPCTFSIIFNSFSWSQRAYPILASVGKSIHITPSMEFFHDSHCQWHKI